MPGTGVYFVNSASSALCAAPLMGSGVPKSGSPAPKSITSTPDRRNSSTLAPTAIVADVAIREVRSANRAMIASITPVAQGVQPREPRLHQFRHQPVNLPAERKHFLDQAGADVRVLLGGHHEDGLDHRIEMPVH